MRLDKLKMAILVSALVTSFSSVAYAGNWMQTDTGWQYKEDGDSFRSDTWAYSDGNWFYLGSDGNLLRNCPVWSNDDLYYVNESGAMVKNEWHFLEDQYDHNNYWYYFGYDGKAYKNRGAKASVKNINGKKYIFDENARMLSGFIDEEGNVVQSNSGAFENALYYAQPDGELYVDKWLNYKEVAGSEDFYSRLGQRDYDSYLQMWMYFGDDARKYKARTANSSVERKINGKKYSFDENGIMIPGIYAKDVSIAATDRKNTILYSGLDTDGSLQGDYWTYTVPSKAMDENDYNNQTYSWFRTKSDGTVYKNRIYTINGKDYVFDKIGRMKTGFVIMLDNGRFGISHHIDDFSGEDFLKSKEDSVIPGIDRGNLYFFSVDDFNDGSKQAGKDVEITLSDDVYTFGFRQSGIAYGNRCKLEYANNAYYYNGLKLKASKDFGYGIVDLAKGNNSDYVVINDKGYKIKGSRVIRDNEGGYIVVKNSKFVARLVDCDKPIYKKGNFYKYDSTLPYGQRVGSMITVSENGRDNLDDGFVVFEQ